MSWKSFAREVQRAQRQAEQRQRAYSRAVTRAEKERERELKRQEREAKAQEKERAKADAASQVGQYEAYLSSLISVHKGCGPVWDWREVAFSSPPPEPIRECTREDEAKATLAAYRPGFFERLFGGDKKQTAKLEVEVLSGKGVDDAAHQAAIKEWKDACTTWETYRDVGGRIVSGDQSAYAPALDLVGAFDEVAKFQTVVSSGEAKPDAILLKAEIKDDEIVPTEIVKQTASGKLSTKAMPKGQYWELYQDHVCSCAIRLGCEMFAALPIERAIINIGKSELSSKTGHPEMVTYLAVHFTRSQLADLNLEHIDPSDSMENFPHRMKLLKTKGFKPVDAITFEDQFVTT